MFRQSKWNIKYMEDVREANELLAETYELFTPVSECPLCGGNVFSDYAIVEFTFRYYECECGMVFQRSYMSKDQALEFYRFKYRLGVDPFCDKVTYVNVHGQGISGERYKKFVDFAPKRHLDVGSSTGEFLWMMQEAYGCEIVGVEPGDTFRDYSIKSGIETVADLSEVRGKFDLISIAQTLEHFVEPLVELETVRRLLDDDGILFIEVPYMGVSFHHPLMFNKTTLEKMLNKTGFDVIKSGEEIKMIKVLAKKRSLDGTNSTRTNEVA